jgi:hypothetical protein
MVDLAKALTDNVSLFECNNLDSPACRPDRIGITLCVGKNRLDPPYVAGRWAVEAEVNSCIAFGAVVGA